MNTAFRVSTVVIFWLAMTLAAYSQVVVVQQPPPPAGYYWYTYTTWHTGPFGYVWFPRHHAHLLPPPQQPAPQQQLPPPQQPAQKYEVPPLGTYGP